MDIFWQYITLSDPNARIVVLGTLMLGLTASLVGCFTFLRKRALVGDAVAHAVLPGVCMAFILSGTKNPYFLLIGSVVAGWISLISIDQITRKTKLKTDAAIGIVLTTFFGLGIMLLTAIQQSGSGNQSGLDKFLFGKAASMTMQDIYLIGQVSLIVLILIGVFFSRFLLVSFDPEFAKAIGVPLSFYEFLLATITILAIAIGIQALGVVLISALLITPALAARFWTHNLRFMLLLAALIGMFSCWLGAFVSYAEVSMPTGPWIVLFLSGIALLSVFFAPGKGVAARLIQQQQHRRKILLENILKLFYYLRRDYPEKSFFSITDMMKTREFPLDQLKRGIRKLARKDLIEKEGSAWKLTAEGTKESNRIVRLHRLWELYLNTRLRLAPDHVHHDAEVMEHIITPELERALEKELDFPEKDPHSSQIPYS